MADFTQSFAGGSAQLSDTFGLKADELAALMNQYRNRALSQS